MLSDANTFMQASWRPLYKNGLGKIKYILAYIAFLIYGLGY